ncbi:MAG: AAA family ATPase [Proteobacteria bacterium]|nr:AAA family ATPase [Pseudomonadota bacterium]
MYRKHFGLVRKPFELTPDYKILFLGESHKEALAVLKHGVVSDKGFLLFTGGVGTGKTTLINVLSKTLENPGYICMISNPTLGIDDFFYYFAAQLGLLFDGNKAKFLFLFSKLLEECKKYNRKVLLIVDEAHALPTDLLEEMRLLVNMAAEVKNVLSIFLVGQPELLNRLTEEQLSSLSQRIAVRYHLHQLSKADSLQYVLFRLNRAGAKNNKLFSDRALDLIYQATCGNPRQINIICDNALFAAYSRDRLEVDEKLIRECVEKLSIPGDESAFFLPPPKNGLWRHWVVWCVLGIVVVEGAVIVYAHQKGWLQPIFLYFKRLLSVG